MCFVYYYYVIREVVVKEILISCNMKLKKTVTCCMRGNSFCIKYNTKVMSQVILNLIRFKQISLD